MRRRAFLATALLPLAARAAKVQYPLVVPRPLVFPPDHGAHPDFRTEWWYYTGNVRDRDGKRFGFELVFFRQGERRGPAANRSAWRIDDLYLAHFAITDIDGGKFYNRRRLNRAGPGLAGASLAQHRIWNGPVERPVDVGKRAVHTCQYRRCKGSRVERQSIGEYTVFSC